MRSCTKRSSAEKSGAFTKRLAALCLAAFIALSLLGCAKTEVPQQTAPIVLPTPTAAPLPARGGSINLPMPTNADLKDPLKVNTEEMLNVFSLIYEGLLAVDQTSALTAGLAETWSSDETGRVWTLKLRNSARWHDNNEKVTAADVKFTYDRLSSVASSYYAYHASKIESVEAVDEYTVRVTMKAAGMASLYALTVPILREDYASAAMPVGTGPYKATFLSTGRLTLTANESWWKQRPYIDTVNFLARDNNETALASFAAGQLDMVPTSAVTAGKYREEGITTVYDILTQNAEFLLLNSANTALRDVNVRMALACGIDRGKIITNVYMNRAQACDVPVAPDSWLYDPASKVYDYDPASALALLKEAGYEDIDGDGFLEFVGASDSELTFTLLVSDSADNLREDAANAVAAQLLELGIQTEVVAAPYSLTDADSDFSKKLKAGEFDLALCGFNLGRDGLVSSFVDAGGANNYGKYASAELSSLAAAVAAAPDEAAYRAAASAFEMQFVKELPFLTLYFRLNSIVYDSAIRGVTGAREPDTLRTADKWYLFTEEG
ncbi:MAG: peptide ABC transporter substrate-binding protein [Clostridiaceae bacterium]|nr:peptide ABC transporter substrate-binding protein [Eubacteriales bacterium]